MSATERVSADLMRWQLQSIVDGERFADTQFPLNQFSGANVSLPNLMTVIHPLGSAKDAESYLARLRLLDEQLVDAPLDAAWYGLILAPYLLYVLRHGCGGLWLYVTHFHCEYFVD